ncbi:MAG: LuxR C-terminal-related transcriptional regulator [Prolixibacteraceae bacterium]
MDSVNKDSWFRSLVDESSAMMFVTNRHNEMIWCNQRYHDLFGHGADYVNKTGIIKYAEENLHPADIDSYLNSMKELANKNLVQLLAIYRQKDVNNAWRKILVTGRVAKWDENDIPEEFFGTGIDITDQFAEFTDFEILLHENIFLKNKLRIKSLTKRELQILQIIASGKSTKEVATEANISFNTVEWHRKNISKKLGINKLSELVRFAVECGL